MVDIIVWRIYNDLTTNNNTNTIVNLRVEVFMKNQDIRELSMTAKVPLWRIASELGVCDMTLTRRLRHELSETDKQKIRNISADLATKEVV